MTTSITYHDKHFRCSPIRIAVKSFVPAHTTLHDDLRNTLARRVRLPLVLGAWVRHSIYRKVLDRLKLNAK